MQDAQTQKNSVESESHSCGSVQVQDPRSQGVGEIHLEKEKPAEQLL